jgi:hypothetical protein
MLTEIPLVGSQGIVVLVLSQLLDLGAFWHMVDARLPR